jgi:hypothetical protein
MRPRLLALVLLLPAPAPALDWSNWPWSERAPDPAAPPAVAAPAHPLPSETNLPSKAPKIRPYRIPTMSGRDVDFRAPMPPMEPVRPVDSDAVFDVVKDCFPEYVSWGVDIDAIAGARYSDDGLFVSVDGTQQSALSKYWVGIVARMPLYSAAEVNRERAEELRRRESVAQNIQALIKALSDRRRAEREVGYFAALEARSRERVGLGIAESAEQIGFGRDYIAAVNKLDEARATIDGARIALVGQCRDEVRGTVNAYLLEVVK